MGAVLIIACNAKKENTSTYKEANKTSAKEITEYKTDSTSSAFINSGNTNDIEFNSNNITYAATTNANATGSTEQINDQIEEHKPQQQQNKPYTETPKKLPSKTYEDWNKKIIKTGNITLELNNYRDYNNQIHKNVQNFGAYIAQEEQTQGDDKLENSIVIKVPVENFDALINSIGGDSIKVIEKKITSQDVTTEVVDTKARIEAKKIVRQQYLELMRQAKNMKDILEVQTEINSIQEDIESAAGRVNYLVHQSSYSTVNLRYYQLLNGKKIDSEDTTGFMHKLKEALKTGSNVIGNILILVLSIWPIIIIGFVSLFLWKKRKKTNTN